MATEKLSARKVPYSGNPEAKLWFIGEAPGQKEDEELIPFVGESGDLLWGILGRYGIRRENVFVHNLCPSRPFGNKFENALGTPELAQNVALLKQLIKTYKPHVIVALGKWAFQVLADKPKAAISAWRGSILSTSVSIPGSSSKLIGTFHPASVLRNGDQYPIVDADICRAVVESGYPELKLPERKFIIDPRGVELELLVDELSSADTISVDIETTKKIQHLLCIGFAADPLKPICIVNHVDAQTSSAIARILTSPAKKIFHFGTFDVLALREFGYITENFWWDTLIAQHVIAPELPRSLAFLTSIYTYEPYYKASGREGIPKDQKSWSTRADKEELYIYNCRDAAVTLEIQRQQEKELLDDVSLKRVFDFEMSELEMAIELSHVGMNIDPKIRDEIRYSLHYEWYMYQKGLDTLIGLPTNVSSPKLKKILYDDLGLPTRYKKGPNGTSTVSADEDAIVANIAFCKDKLSKLVQANAKANWEHKLLVLKTILKIRGIRKLLSSYIDVKLSVDNRARGVYKVANTETGRWAAEKYIDDTGFNPQTVPRSAVEIVAKDPQINLPLLEAELDDDSDEREEED